MPFDPDIYRRCVADYNEWDCRVDEMLYELCRRFPDHRNPQGVAAKCWIIGRTYATGIERQIDKDGRQGGSMSKLVHWLAEPPHAHQVDCLIAELRALHPSLTADGLRNVVGVHGKFVDLLREVVRTGETPRSFAAKYLHFHCPIVPIYDSIVSGIIPSQVRWQQSLLIAFDPCLAGDDDYVEFCCRFWRLYVQAQDEIGSSVTVKLVDQYLLLVRDIHLGRRRRP